MSYAMWPGDTSSANFQQLEYNSTLQELSLIPFGNTVQIQPQNIVTSSITSDYLGISTALYLIDTVAGPKIATGAGLALNFLPEPAVSSINGVLNVGFSNAAVTIYKYASTGMSYWDIERDTNGNALFAQGPDAGSNFHFDRLNPSGGYIDTPFSVDHSDGSVTINTLNVTSINGFTPPKIGYRQNTSNVQITTATVGATPQTFYDFQTLISGHSYRATVNYNVSCPSGSMGDFANISLWTSGSNIADMNTHIYSNISGMPIPPAYTSQGILLQDGGSNMRVVVTGSSSNVWNFTGMQCILEDLGVLFPDPSYWPNPF